MRYNEKTGTCSYWRDVDNPRKHRAYVLYNMVFSGEYDAFDLHGLKQRLEPYDLGYTDKELRRELASYVNFGWLDAHIDGWVVCKADATGHRWNVDCTAI